MLLVRHTDQEVMMSIRCGNCTRSHETVAEVRACYSGQSAPRATETAQAAARETAKGSFRPMTEPMKKYLDILVAERDTTLFAARVALFREGSLGFDGARTLIDQLKKAPKVGQHSNVERTPLPEVPEGRYAVVDPTDGVLKFYRVDRPTEGRWAGRTFVKVQASDELHRVSYTRTSAVLAEIAKDPRAASLRYGQELGKCGVCGRTLTDESSRSAGIGPICASKQGW